MVGITSAQVLLATLASLAYVSHVVAQVVDENNPDVKAAIFHAAGNSTKVQSDIVITSPTQDTVWYTQSHNTITWTGSTPSEFAVMLVYKNPTSRASGISLIANEQTSTWTVDTRIGKIEAGKYFVRFYNPQDTTKEIAVSAEFTIDLKKDKPVIVNGTTVAAASNDSSASPMNGNNSQSPAGWSQAVNGTKIANGAASPSYATNAQTNTRAAVKRRDPPPPQPAAFPIPMKRKQTQSQNKRVNARDAIPMQPVKAPAEKRVIRPVETGKA